MNHKESTYFEQGGEDRMEHSPISEETREKIEEATISLFMDQYAKVLDAGADSMMEECADDAFPAELDKRIQNLIAKECAKERNKQRRKTALRMLRSAAAVIIVMLSVCSVLFVTVEAFRVPVINFFVDKTDNYWEISAEEKENKVSEVFNEENPLGGILPEKFVLMFLAGSLENGNLIADYEDTEQRKVSLYVNHASGNNQTDTEDANAVDFELVGYKAMIATEENTVRITWINNDISKVITVRAVGMSEDDAIIISAKLAELL